MKDISGLNDRIQNLEYYTSLNLLEQSASSLQIQDNYGLNRFKNGILVDNFTTFTVADTYNGSYFAKIDTKAGTFVRYTTTAKPVFSVKILKAIVGKSSLS
jgi:hypothetical protein